MNSLLKQMQKAGLVDKKKAGKAQHQKRVQKDTQEVARQRQAKLAKEAEERKQRDRALNQKKQEEVAQKAIVAQVKQLVLMNQIKADKEASLEFQFTVANKIQRIVVTGLTRQQLIKGKLAIAWVDAAYYVIPRVVAEKIKQRLPETIVYEDTTDEPTVDADDPYADFAVPDDLIW